MVAVPALVELNVTEQVAVPAVVPAANVHGLPVNEAPVAMPVCVKVTEPVGVTTVPVVVESLTVAVQVLDWPVLMVVGVHTMLVVVARGLTVTVAAVVVLLTA